MNKGKGGLLSNTMKAMAKRRVEMEEAIGGTNTSQKKSATRKAKPKKKKNKNKAYTPPKMTKAQKQKSLEAARARQSSRVSAGKKKTDSYGSYE